MEYWEIKLEAERLRLSSPDVVYAWLSALPPDPLEIHFHCPGDVVEALLSRDHPLIDLGLARYTSNCLLIRHLWNKSDVLKTALLSNSSYGPIFPASRTLHFADDVQGFIKDLDDDNMAVLYHNKLIMPELLERTFKNEIGLSERQHSRACRYAAANELLHQKRENVGVDDFRDKYCVSKARSALWNLVLTAPATEDWAVVLNDARQAVFEIDLPKEFQPDRSALKDDREFYKAWKDRNEAYRRLIIDAAETRWLGPPDKSSSHIWVLARSAFAGAVCRAQPDNPPIDPNHSDLGFRIGFYSGAAVSQKWNIEEMADRDGDEFFDAVVSNNTLFEGANWTVYRRVWVLAGRRHSKWMKERLEALSKKDPARYDYTPTAQEVLEEERRIEAQAAAAPPPKAPEPERTAPPKPAKRGWRPFG